jgi:hypothetical protein
MAAPLCTTGVLTFHRCINYGSYWQARSLVAGLRARGHRAVLLDHHSARVTLAEWRCALQPVLPTAVPRRDRLLYGAKLLKFQRAFARLPCSPRFALDNPANLDPYDQVVVGSDEVWNLHHPWYGGNRLFWGDGLPTPRLVAYAASCGSYDAAAGLGPDWADRLRRFAAISVRDTTSRRLVQDALGTPPDLVLDPCLQFPQPVEGPWRGPRQRFVAVYGHNFSPAFQQQVQYWAKTRGVPLLSLGYRNDWADQQWLTAGPEDFAPAMARADAVATNFFHGCVFALRNARPFVCETTPYRANKVRDLLATVDGEAHLMDPDTSAATYAAHLEQPLAPAILARIADLRRTSTAYLDRALA